jgi:hypothetical protein
MRDSNSTVLKAKIRLVEPRLQQAASRFWNHPQIERVFRLHLARLYFTINASKPLLECALARSRELADDCSVAKRLVPYFEKHIIEEAGHDEWILDDLRVLGVSREEVTSRLPPAEAATLAGSQYYYINHVHPLAVVSYQAVVEGSPPRKEFLDGIVARTSIPEAALGSFYKHAEIDVHHGRDLWALLDSLPLQPWHETLLGINAMLVTDQLACFLESLLAKVDGH